MTQLKIKLIAIAWFLLFVFSGALISTQITASRYGYHRSLGEPLVSLFNLPLYSPLKIIRWNSSGLLKNSQVGGAYLWIVLGIGTGILGALGIRIIGEKGESLDKTKIFGDAAFATEAEITSMNLTGKGRGVFLGKTKDGKYLRHDGPEHYAVIAPTRSGKGAGIVVPTLLSWKGSAVIYDLKEENYRRTSLERSKFSDILYFNPNTLDTVHFNPLLEIRPGLLEVRDAQNLANMIVEPDMPGVRDHWVRTGNSLLTAAILHVLYVAPRGEKNLAGVTALLSRAEKNLTETLHEMLETKHMRDATGKPTKPHPGVVAAARDVLNKSPDDKSSVVSTVMGYLDVYRDPLLANATRDSDFTIDELVNGERPKSLYMVIPASDIERLRPIIRIMVSFICRRLTEQAVRGSRDQEHKHKLILMLDEFTKLGRLEFFESALGFLAGYGIKGMLVMQSLSELRQVYGERTSLLDNTHVRVFFRPETIETAEYISRTLGQSTVEYKTRGESGSKGSPFFSNVNEALHISGRPLLTPREVMELPDDESLVLVGGGKPIRAKKIRYYDFKTDLSFKPLLGEPPLFMRVEGSEKQSVWFKPEYSPPEDYEVPREEKLHDEEKSESKDEDLLVVTNGEERSELQVLKEDDSDDDTEELP